MLTGTFTPTPSASTISAAPHFAAPSTPVTVRFSSSTGIPLIPDNDPNANPRGFAIRFNLGEHVHTDIVAHSTPAFPTRTGAEFLEFLKALIASGAPGVTSPTPVEQFLGSHPSALAFVQYPKPSPVSFATQEYFGVTAFKFVNAEGKESYIRYLIEPAAGVSTLSDVTGKDVSYLFDELPTRVAASPVAFKLSVQVAGPNEEVNDATVHWAESTPVVALGTLVLDKLVADNDATQKQIIFDPIPRVKGIEASDDPLLELRAAVYLISGRERRKA
jgi:catalase